MPQLTIPLTYSFDSGLLITPSELMSKYLFGVTLSKDGQTMPEEVIKQYILEAQSLLENYLDIKLTKEVVNETKDFWIDDWRTWSYIPCTYPVNCLLKIEGFVGSNRVIEFPQDWVINKSVTTTKGQSDYYSRNIYMVPNFSSASFFNSYVYSGTLIPLRNYSATYGGVRQLPGHWRISYITGWSIFSVPPIFRSIIGKLVAVQLLGIAGEILFPRPGIASSTLSLDGLTETMSTAVSGNATPYTPRIKLYVEQITKDLEMLSGMYKSIAFNVL